MRHFGSHEVIEAPSVTARVHIATDLKRDEKGFIPLLDENPRGRHRTLFSKLLAVPTCNDDYIILMWFKRLLYFSFIHDIIPVGSQGILHEAQIISEDSDLRFTLRLRAEVDVRKSAGPGTALLRTCRHSDLGEIIDSMEKPVNLVGVLS